MFQIKSMLKAQDNNTQKERKTISRKHRRSIQKPNQYDRSPINLIVIMHLLSMYCRTETRKNNNKEAIIVNLMLKTQTNPNQKNKNNHLYTNSIGYSSIVSIFLNERGRTTQWQMRMKTKGKRD